MYSNVNHHYRRTMGRYIVTRQTARAFGEVLIANTESRVQTHDDSSRTRVCAAVSGVHARPSGGDVGHLDTRQSGGKI